MFKVVSLQVAVDARQASLCALVVILAHPVVVQAYIPG
jgi:hypothetical protein